MKLMHNGGVSVHKNFIIQTILYKYGKGKSKAIPLQAWTGPEGSRRLRFPDFKKIET